MPECAEAHCNLGVALKELGQFDEAEASYRQATVLKPDFFNAHNNLGNLLRDARRLDEAEASYLQAIKLKPDFAEAHSNLGVTQAGLGLIDEAETSYKKAIALRPDFVEALLNLCDLLEKNNDIDELSTVLAGVGQQPSRMAAILITIRRWLHSGQTVFRKPSPSARRLQSVRSVQQGKRHTSN